MPMPMETDLYEYACLCACLFLCFISLFVHLLPLSVFFLPFSSNVWPFNLECLWQTNWSITFYYSALEDAVPDEAIQLYTDACSILEEDDKEQMAFDLYRAATCVYIKLEK